MTDTCRMKSLVAIAAGLAALVVALDPADARRATVHPSRAVEWRTVGRGTMGGDSLVVRALWGFDPDNGESTFVKYRIEDSRGRTLHADTLSDGGWCESFDARFKPWRGGVRVEMGGTFYPCPDECSSVRYVYLAPDTAAVSEWFGTGMTQIEFDDLGRSTAWESEYGVFWRMRIEPVIDREKLTFGVNLSQRALAGNPIRVDVREHACNPRYENRSDSLITIFPSPISSTGTQMMVPLGATPRFLSGIAVVDRNVSEMPMLRRVELEIARQRGWVDVGDLQVLGCSEP